MQEESCWFCEEIFFDTDSLEDHLSEVHDVTFVKEGNLIDVINEVLGHKGKTLH